MLLHELEPLFRDVHYPGDIALAYEYPNEYEGTLKQLYGKNWRRVTLDDFDSQGGVQVGVQALSPKGHLYFLPGLIRIALTEADSRYTIVHALTPTYTCPDYLEQWYRQKEQHRYIDVLSWPQREFLCRFLADMLEADTDEDFCPAVVNAAIESLKTGTLRAYKSKDVEKWVADVLRKIESE